MRRPNVLLATPDGARLGSTTSWDADLRYLYRDITIVAQFTGGARADIGFIGTETFRVVVDYGQGPKTIIEAALDDIAAVQDRNQSTASNFEGFIKSVTYPNMNNSANDELRTAFTYHFRRDFADEVMNKLLGFGTVGLKEVRFEIDIAASYGASVVLNKIDAFADLDEANEEPGIIPIIRKVHQSNVSGAGLVELNKIPGNSLAGIWFKLTGAETTSLLMEADGKKVYEIPSKWAPQLARSVHNKFGTVSTLSNSDEDSPWAFIKFTTENRIDQVFDTRGYAAVKYSVGASGAGVMNVIQEIWGSIYQ